MKLVDPNKDPTGLADVLMKSLGLTGVMVLIAVVAGIVMAGLLFLGDRGSRWISSLGGLRGQDRRMGSDAEHA